MGGDFDIDTDNINWDNNNQLDTDLGDLGDFGDVGGISNGIRVTIGGVCALVIFIIVCVVLCCCFCSCCCVNKRRRCRHPRTRVAYLPANQSTPTIINHTPPPQINNYHNHHVYPPAGGHGPPYQPMPQPLYPVVQTSSHQNASAPPPYPYEPSYNPPSNPHYH